MAELHSFDDHPDLALLYTCGTFEKCYDMLAELVVVKGVPICYWPVLILLDWTIRFWMEVYTHTTYDLKGRQYIVGWHTMSKQWLRYHTLVRDLISQQVRDLLQSPVNDPICLDLFDKWMHRTIWRVHFWVKDDLEQLCNTLKVDIFDKVNKTRISVSNLFLME
jgi:hypothetical protein